METLNKWGVAYALERFCLKVAYVLERFYPKVAYALEKRYGDTTVIGQ